MNNILYPDFSGHLINMEFGFLYDPGSQEQIYPTSGSVTVKDVSGAIIINAGAVTINATTGAISYDFTIPESQILLDENPNYDFRAEWEFLSGGFGFEFVKYFDVLPWQTGSQLTDRDVIDSLPILDDMKNKTMGKATGGTATTLTDTHLNDPSGVYIGAELEIKAGSSGNKGFERQVISYDSSTNTFTFDKPFPFPVKENDSYHVSKGFAPTRREAFKEIIAKLKQTFGGHSISEIIDINDVTIAHKYLTIAKLAQQRIDNIGDKWDAHSQKNYTSFTEAMNRAEIKFQKIGADGANNSSIVKEHSILVFAK